MKSRSEFNKLEDYKDYLVAYYAGQAMTALITSNGVISLNWDKDAVLFANCLVDRLNLKSERASTPSYKNVNLKEMNRTQEPSSNYLNPLKGLDFRHLTPEQVNNVIDLDRHDILQNPNEK